MLGEAIYAAWDWFCNALAPILSEIFANIGRMIGGVVDIVVGVIQVITGLIKGFKDGDWSLFVDGLKSIWDGFWAIASAPFVAVYNVLTEYIAKFGLTWSDVWNGIKYFFFGIWEAIKTFIANTLDAINTKISTTFEAIKTFITTTLQAIQTTMQNIWNAINMFVINTVEAIKTQVSKKFEALKSAATQTIENLKNAAQNKFNEMKTNVTNTVENIKSQVSSKMSAMKDAVVQTISNMASSIISKAQEIYNGIVNTFSDIKSKMEDVGSNIVNGIWQGISNGWDWLKNKVANLANSLLDTAKDALGIESPSKEFEKQVGVWLPPGIANGFAKALPAAMADMESELDDGLSEFDVRDIDIVGLSNSFMTVVTEVTDWFTSIEERLAQTVDAVKTDIANLIGVGQLVLNSDGTISGLVMNRPSDSLELSTPGRGNNSGNGGETINNFTFYSNTSIDEIQAAKLLKETQRDLAEGYL